MDPETYELSRIAAVVDIEKGNNDSNDFVRRREKDPTKRQVRPQSGHMRSGIISNPKLTRSIEYLGDGSSKRQSKHLSSLNLAELQKLTQEDDESSEPELPVSSNHDYHQNKKNELKLVIDAPEKSPEVSKNSSSKYLGILLSMFASFVFSLGSIIIKSISKQYNAFSLSLWTFQGILIPSIVVLIFQKCVQKQPVFKGVWPPTKPSERFNLSLVLIRALLGAGGTVLKVLSLQYMTAADSTVITFSSPVFVVLIAWMFLREDCGLVSFGTSLVVLLGVLLITRPPWITGEKEFDMELLTGCLMAFSCMLLGTFAVVILRYVRNVHYAVITLIYGVIGTIVSLSLSFLVGGPELPKCLKHWLYALGVAKLTFIGQSTLTLAFKYEEAGPIAVVRTSEIIFIFGWQFLFLRVIPDWLSIVGAIVVVIGVSIVAARKSVSSLPENHSARKYCSVLLL